MYLISIPSPTYQKFTFEIVDMMGEKICDNGIKNDTYYHLKDCGVTAYDLVKDVTMPQAYYRIEMTYKSWYGRKVTEDIPISVTWINKEELEQIKKEYEMEE